MNFIKEYPLENIKPASYNPRLLNDDAFVKLQESIKMFGMCKPIVINKNGTIVAGHQRTKTLKELGIKYAPCLILDKNMKIDEEIRFNLMHNSIENETSKIIVRLEELSKGYNIISHNDIDIIKKGEGNRIYETCKLLNRYGDYGCIICDNKGNVLHNNDYGFCSKILQRNTLIYVIDDNIEEFKTYINNEYGEYSYSDLSIKSYSQTHCQMTRCEKIHSRLYENYVLPNINKNQRIFDFGAGKCFYINKLKKEGFMTNCYEPFFNGDNSNTIKIGKVKEMIKSIECDVKENGLYDVVILDSVLNSVINNDFEDKVLKSCNSLLKNNGVFYVSTRNIDGINRESSRVQTYRRQIGFLDKNNFTGTFRKGTWTIQHFHSIDSFEMLLKSYFKEVEVYLGSDKSQLFAICKTPILFNKQQYKEALDIEFNMEYPNNTYLNIHGDLVNNILYEKCEKKEL